VLPRGSWSAEARGPALALQIDGGIDAILIKVAAAGLTPEKHLGARLAELPGQLHKLRRCSGASAPAAAARGLP
jgi:diphthamide synthase (EF-2-diphthine--ammonia ligase)